MENEIDPVREARDVEAHKEATPAAAGLLPVPAFAGLFMNADFQSRLRGDPT